MSLGKEAEFEALLSSDMKELANTHLIECERWRTIKSKKTKFKDCTFIISGPKSNATFIGKIYGHEGTPHEEMANLICNSVNNLSPEQRRFFANHSPNHPS